MIGQTLGPYRILEKLGQGGMGEVYKALDTRLERIVAIKVLPRDRVADPERRRRLLREARSASALDHPNIVTVFDIGSDAGVDYLVMEYVQGRSLDGLIAHHGLPLSDTLAYAAQIASALAAAHAAGIVHRDIKPSNILVTPDGRVKVVDFGLAKLDERAAAPDLHPGSGTRLLEPLLTEAGVVMGTMAYLSPEQARAEHVDARTDLFSFGAVLYEMATGRRAFPKALDWTTPPAESLPPELRSIVQKLLAPDRDLRYQSATDVAVDVRRCDAGRTPVSPGAVRAPGDSRPAAASWRRLSPVTLGVVAGATLVVVALVFFVPSTSPGDSPASIGSIAVLPLRNISGDPAQDYFADGMTDALITSLAKLQAFRVASRTSVMQFRDAARPLPDIARQLAVDGIVEGTVLRDGSFVRISVRLIDGRSDSGVWAESYDRDLGDVLMLQGDVARAIAAAVGATLSEQAAARLTGARPVNPEAYDTYLRARYAFSRVNEEDSLRAVALFERAIALDPGFAPAHAELGLANLYVFNFYRPGDAVWGERARAATERALSIDPDLAEARITRGRLVWTPGQGYQHVQAAREYRRALELNPSLDEARFQLSQVLGHSGLLDEALEVLSQIDPAFASGRIREAVAQARLYLGLHEEALTSLMEVPADYNPTLVGHEKAWALVALGRDDEALAVLDEYTREFPQDPAGTFDSVRALIHARRDNRGEAERLITVAIRKDRNSLQFHHTSYAVAAAYAGLGDHDDALTWLEFTAANGFPCGTLFEHDPNFEAIRRHPRFSRLLEAVRRQSNDLRALLAP